MKPSCCVLLALVPFLASVIAQKDSKDGKDSKSSTKSSPPGKDDNSGSTGKDSKNTGKEQPKGKSVIDPKLVANTPSGSFLGKYTFYRGRIWRSIRYGKAPVGGLRFEAPQKPDVATGIVDVNGTAPGCMQAVSWNNVYIPKLMSEDCLFLSVTAPEKDPTSNNKYPVLIYFHGGSYIEGYGANSPLYDPQSFVQNGIVVVLVNYRLGALGFLTTSSLRGNYGFLDQRLAMQWVRDNIAAFGGDSNRVTIAGQSAGAHSILCHMVSTGSQGLFQAAILDSTPFITLDTKAEATATAQTIFDAIGCQITDTNCIKYNTAATAIVSAQESVSSSLVKLAFAPILDPTGDIVQQPLDLFLSGYFPKIPMLIGFNSDEGTTFVAATFPNPVNQATYSAFEAGLVGAANVAYLNAYYPWTTSTADGRDLIDRIVVDYGFACPALGIAAFAAASHPSTKIFVYEFTHSFTNPTIYDSSVPRCRGRVCHGTDIEFDFNTFGGPGSYSYQPTADERKLATSTNNGWSNFIKNSDPNIGSTVTTARYIPFDPTSKQYVTIDTASKSTHRSYPSGYTCSFWAAT